MTPLNERLVALNEYEEQLRPCMTGSFAALFSDYVNAMTEAFATRAPAERFDKAQDDPLLQRRWEPDVVLLSREGTDKPDEEVVMANEVLLDGKIYSGYQGETRMFFKQSGSTWLLDEITTRRRYTYDDSTWEPVQSTREQLRSGIEIYSRDIKNYGQQGGGGQPATSDESE